MWQIYHALLIEQLSPIRIILGYHGFKSEFSLRTALIDFVSKNISRKGFGVIRFPQLIISGQYSIVKLNGQPYNPTVRPGLEWEFYASSRVSPILFLLELIWTKLEREYHIDGFWGEYLQQECLSPLLYAKAIKIDGNTTWAYYSEEPTTEQLQARTAIRPWEPSYIDFHQFTIFNTLGVKLRIDVSEPDFINWVPGLELNPEEFITSLVQTGLTARSGKLLQLITEQLATAAFPNGQFVAADNNTGRLSRWLSKTYPTVGYTLI